MTLQWIEGPQGRLRVDDGGEGGPPVLLVHGLAASLTVWKHQLPHLRRTRRAVAIDLRGMGESTPPRDGDYSLEAMADDVEAVARALGLETFVLAGHSWASAVVGTYAAARPERVTALVLVDAGASPRDFPAEEIAEYRRRLAEDYDRFTDTWWDGILANAADEVRRLVKGALRATPREVFTAALEASARYDARATLARYPGPRCAIVAEAFDTPAAVHRAVPGIPYRVMRKVSHWLMLDRPDEFNRHLEDLLLEVAATPR